MAAKGDALSACGKNETTDRPTGVVFLPLAGMCLSGIGSWCTRIAIAWLIVRQTQSPLWLGLAAFAGQSPVFFCAPLAARLLARMTSRRIYRATQILAALEAAGLALLAWRGWLSPEMILFFAGLRGVVSAFEHPARQTLVGGFARSPDGLRTAMAGDGLQANLARLAGPLCAGLLLARSGETACFLVDAASYCAALAASLALPAGDRRVSSAISRRRQLGALFRLRPGCLKPLMLLATISLVGTTFTVLLPQFCREVLAGGAESLARLVAASGVGASVAAVAMIFRPQAFSSRQLPPLCAFSGISIALLWLVRDQTAAIACVGAASLFLMLQVSITAASLREAQIDGFDPAVLQSALFWGLMPFGSLLMSALAHLMGPCGAYLTAGTTAIAAATLLSWPARQPLRPTLPPSLPAKPGNPTAHRLGLVERSLLTKRLGE